MESELNPKDYYRLPWTLNDNVLGWLEPTKRCNLYCEGCYSRNDPKSDRSLAEIRTDLEVFQRHRRLDSISIAGGDPLVHPDIVEIVRMIRQDFGYKPILNTNGLALTPQLLHKLKVAGLFGFTLHVDSSQSRPHWKGKTELELCELRLQFAQMIAAEGGLSLAFNSTVFRHTLSDVPKLMEWAAKHIDIVHSMVFILFRTSRQTEYDYFAGGKPIDVEQLVYFGQDKNPEPLTAHDVVAEIRKTHPQYSPCAYLGGTHDPDSFKWLVSLRLGTKQKVHGYLGPRYMETAQVAHHLVFNRYFAYTDPGILSHGRRFSALLSPIDGGARRTVKSYLGAALSDPRELVRPLHIQSVVIIQPIDFLPDGSANMCDGCPDMTVHNGQLVWSCRLDERKEHGCWLNAAPRRSA
ncbi:MAG: radical SAM protein [Polyangiaceae bacterium]|nr:radical SAM protein [Polyangiaceae bacterium]